MARIISTSYFFLVLLEFFAVPETSAQLPIRMPGTVYSSNSTCPVLNLFTNENNRVGNILLDYYNRSRSCGGPGWTRVAYLNMSDTNQQCPTNWNLTSSPVRGCGRSSRSGNTCDSVIYPVNGHTYSSVCGRINAYQRGSSYGLYNSLYYDYTLDQSYLSGLSVTHGPAGNRTHIWSFVGAASELSSIDSLYRCPCTSNNVNWPHQEQVPSFLKNDYFCDTGNFGSFDYTFPYYTEDPLWDGKGCGPTSTCCSFNSLPWFYKSLPQPTSDDLEIRICSLDRGVRFEDKLISELGIYVS